GVLWLALELRARPMRAQQKWTALSFHNVVAIAVAAMMLFMIVPSVLVPRSASLLLEIPSLTWVAFVSVFLLMAATLWDKHAKYSVAGLYALGLCAAAILFHQLNLTPNRLEWSAAIFLALYSLLVAIIWRNRDQVIAYAARAGIPRRIMPETTELPWLAAVTLIAITIVGLLAYSIDIKLLQFGLRATAALALITQFFVLAQFAEGRNAENWRRFSLAVLVVGLVLLGWSGLTPGIIGTWLNRSVIMMLE